MHSTLLYAHGALLEHPPPSPPSTIAPYRHSSTVAAISYNFYLGSLFAGSETCRLRNKITFTLHGTRGAQSLPADPWIKGMGVTGSIDLHGAQYYPTWTRLAMTAKIGDTWLYVQGKNTKHSDAKRHNHYSGRKWVCTCCVLFTTLVSSIQ